MSTSQTAVAVFFRQECKRRSGITTLI